MYHASDAGHDRLKSISCSVFQLTLQAKLTIAKSWDTKNMVLERRLMLKHTERKETEHIIRHRIQHSPFRYRPVYHMWTSNIGQYLCDQDVQGSVSRVHSLFFLTTNKSEPSNLHVFEGGEKMRRASTSGSPWECKAARNPLFAHRAINKVALILPILVYRFWGHSEKRRIGSSVGNT